MSGLRLALLVIGVVIVVGVYLYSRRQAASRSNDIVSSRTARNREPSLDGASLDWSDDMPDDLPSLRALDDDDPGIEENVSSTVAERSDDDEAAVKLPSDEKIIVLNILPQTPDAFFPGSDLLEVFDRAGLEYGQYNVFHRMKETGKAPLSVFSVASATEPGSFDITTMADEEFRGLTLFMLLPGPMRGVDAFADMLATSRRIAEQIRGEVKDRNRSTLTRQTAHHMREEIIAFEHRLQHQG